MNRIEELYRLYLEKYGRIGLLRRPSVPKDMQDGSPDSSGWVSWKPIPSRITKEQVKAVEVRSGLPFPALFTEYLTFYHTMEVDLGWIRIMGLPSDEGIKAIEKWVFEMDMSEPCIRNGYIIFGVDGDDLGYLCFDANRRIMTDAGSDCPVVLVEHGRSKIKILGEVAGGFGELLDKMITLLASSD